MKAAEMFSLTGRVALVTGASSGLGTQFAKALADNGAAVALVARRADRLKALKGEIESKGGKAVAVEADVTDHVAMVRAFGVAEKAFGTVTILVNNAGTAAPMMKFWELTPEQYEDVVRTNILGTMNGTRVAVNGMLAQGFGALYNLEGFGARGQGMRGMTLYGSTKACVHYINRSILQEVKGTPVITGAIAPGMVITDMITRQYVGREAELERAKPILNIIAERPEAAQMPSA